VVVRNEAKRRREKNTAKETDKAKKTGIRVCGTRGQKRE
jgi:hypothetical protein